MPKRVRFDAFRYVSVHEAKENRPGTLNFSGGWLSSFGLSTHLDTGILAP
jgi:hypothetical protein